MRRLAILAMTAVVVLVAVTAFAQAKPNFAGKWTMVPDANAPAGAAGGRGGMMGLGQEVTIVQDAATITLTRTTQAGEIKSVYKLDGSESKNTLTFGGNSIDQLSKAVWDGNKLVITSTMNMGGTAAELGTTLSLDATGNLVVESTRPDFQGGGAPVKTTVTYKKG